MAASEADKLSEDEVIAQMSCVMFDHAHNASRSILNRAWTV